MSTKLVFYLIQLLEGLGVGAFFPIYTPWLELHGLNFFKMGAVNFFYHISSSMLDPLTGLFADKFDKRRAFILGQIFWTSTLYIYGASTQIYGFLLAEGIAAVGNSLKTDALESWLQNKLGEKESSRVMGNARVLFTLGQVTTSILAGYLSNALGMQAAWYTAGTFFLVATVLGSITLAVAGRDTSESSKAEVSLREILAVALANKKIRTVGLVVAAYNFASKPMFMYWPQIVASMGMHQDTRGWSVLAIALPTMLGGFITGKNVFLSRDKTGLFRAVMLLGTGLAVSAVANDLGTFFIGLTIMEVAYGSARIAVYGHLFSEIDPRHRSTVNSLISATRTLGGAISLLVMGAIADWFSPQACLALGACFTLATGIAYARTKE